MKERPISKPVLCQLCGELYRPEAIRRILGTDLCPDCRVDYGYVCNVCDKFIRECVCNDNDKLKEGTE